MHTATKRTLINTPSGTFIIRDTDTIKIVSGPGYASIFDKTSGIFLRWGDTTAEDPTFSPAGPELLDLEISVNGCPNACTFCYKSNTNVPAKNMSLETFSKILDRMPATLTQIAFGITGVQTNPDFIAMLKLTRERGIVPNFTLSGIDLTPELAKEIAKYVGGLAVSLYEDSLEAGLAAISDFVGLGVKQVNVHLMLSEQSEPWIRKILSVESFATYPELQKVNAFVLLGVKPVGRAEGHFTPISYTRFVELMQYVLKERKIPLGFDSCTAPKFLSYVREDTMYTEAEKARLEAVIESCESGIMSAYINVDGIYYPCSFSERSEVGLDVLAYESFLDVWYDPIVEDWRSRLERNTYDGCRHCPLYELED